MKLIFDQLKDKNDRLSVLENQLKYMESRIDNRLTEKDHEINFLKDKLDEYQCSNDLRTQKP